MGASLILNLIDANLSAPNTTTSSSSFLKLTVVSAILCHPALSLTTTAGCCALIVLQIPAVARNATINIFFIGVQFRLIFRFLYKFKVYKQKNRQRFGRNLF